MKRYELNGEEFMWVTPSVTLMNSTLIRSIVQCSERQLVVSLKTGLLTSHRCPKVKIPKDTVIYYHYDEDTYVKLSHDVNLAIARVTSTGVMGTIEIKGVGVALHVLGNLANFSRAMKKLYKDLEV